MTFLERCRGVGVESAGCVSCTPGPARGSTGTVPSSGGDGLAEIFVFCSLGSCTDPVLSPCVPCPAEMWAVVGASSCTPCPSGSIAIISHAHVLLISLPIPFYASPCKSCPSGKYATNQGIVMCYLLLLQMLTLFAHLLKAVRVQFGLFTKNI